MPLAVEHMPMSSTVFLCTNVRRYITSMTLLSLFVPFLRRNPTTETNLVNSFLWSGYFHFFTLGREILPSTYGFKRRLFHMTDWSVRLFHWCQLRQSARERTGSHIWGWPTRNDTNILVTTIKINTKMQRPTTGTMSPRSMRNKTYIIVTITQRKV